MSPVDRLSQSPKPRLFRRDERAIWVLIAVFALYQFAYLAIYFRNGLTDIDHKFFSDFFAFWSFARFSHIYPADQLYDIVKLQTFEHSLPGHFQLLYPFLYSPIYLLFCFPFGYLGYLGAFLAWNSISLAVYGLAISRQHWRNTGVLVALAAPTTLISVIFGQNGLLSAALLLGGFRLIGRRPLLAGMVLGCLVFKPQLFVLIPLILLVSGRWRVLAGVALSILCLCAITSLGFGIAPWHAWLRTVPLLWQIFKTNQLQLSPLMPTVTSALLQLGIPRSTCGAVQTLVAALVTATLLMIFYRSGRSGKAPRPLDSAALIVGIFLVTPYAYVYDMPMVSCAVVLVIESCARFGRAWRSGEATVLAVTLLLPIAMLGLRSVVPPAAPLLLGLLFVTILRIRVTMPDDPVDDRHSSLANR